jgi:hypothetical protein
MKRVLTAIVLAMFTAGVVGCHASADIDKPDDNNTSYKKETTVKKTDDGYKTTKTETKVDH